MDLADILRKSKAIMNHDTLDIKESSGDKPNPDFVIPNTIKESLTSSGPINEEAIMKSGLPDSIKQAFIDNPIDMNPTLNVSNDPAFADLLETTNTPIPQQNVAKPNNIRETPNSGLSESVIRFIVKEEIEKALKNIQKPKISESQLQNTMLKMIKEGKLTIKKK